MRPAGRRTERSSSRAGRRCSGYSFLLWWVEPAGVTHSPRARHSGVATPVARGGPSRPDSRGRSNCNWGLSISPWTKPLVGSCSVVVGRWRCSKMELVASRRRGLRQGPFADAHTRRKVICLPNYYLGFSLTTPFPSASRLSSRTMHLSCVSCTPGSLLTPHIVSCACIHVVYACTRNYRGANRVLGPGRTASVSSSIQPKGLCMHVY